MKTLLLLLLLCAGVVGVGAQTGAQSSYDLKGVKHAFDRNSPVPAPGPTYTFFACFVGVANADDPVPNNTVKVYSMIYRFDGAPSLFNFREPGGPPDKVAELYLGYLAKNYGFNAQSDRSYVKVSNTLKGIEHLVSEDIARTVRLSPKDKLLFDDKFSFRYQGTRYLMKYPAN